MIHGLTPQLPEAGKIKIGSKGKEVKSAKGNTFRPPVKYDHFEITTTERNNDGDFIVDTALMDRIKNNDGMANKDGHLIGIPIRFLYNDTDLNFRTELLCYAGRNLACRGDGKTAFKRVTDFEKEHKCPCSRIELDYTGKDKCKYFGTLTCIIDEAGLLGQAHKFRTTSRNSVLGILGGIELIKTATGGIIAGLPLMLTLNPKTTTIPGGGTTTVYVVSVCYRGSMADMRAAALSIAREQSEYSLNLNEIEERVKQLPAPPESAEEQAETAEEFFPDAIEGEVVKATNVEVSQDDQSQKDAGSEETPGAGDAAHDQPENSETESGDDNNPDTATQNTASIKGLPPEGAYSNIFDRLQDETDLEKAIPLMKRLKKENIIYWLSLTVPDLTVNPADKKPEIVEVAEKVLTEKLGTTSDATQEETHQEDTTDDPSVDTAENSQGAVDPGQWDAQEIEGEETTEDKPPEFPREWDNSGPITREQCLKLVELKEDLISAEKLSPSPDAWAKNVNYFLDANGTPISKATQLTTTQGANLIRTLEYHRDHIPF